ncbi:OLC1v1031708C2 [Oldenlandia corymbosa var. corymbosa]|uniref:OLC1v1031708C2 n=1 Tax=Oldenlandia corymbosa var. corymbosa TaxID=529605 RepID=A0AAV1CJ75_OLDCO|nr:OLC1v1031708C2 [Oldenlandia corymbosa var. corymbosa]
MAKLKDRKKNKKMATDKMDGTHEGDQQPAVKEKSQGEEENRERKKLKTKKRNKDQKTDAVGVGSETNQDNDEDGFVEQNGSFDEVRKSKKTKPKQKKDTKSPSNKVHPKAESYSKEGNGFTGDLARGNEVYQISSGDEDCSKGMKKWIMDYQYKRPGLKVLQERIDDFITRYEAKEEQERREREARAAEDGWTVVTHQKGRKKTTDTETGVVVGSVTQAAVLDKMSKKKSKDVGVDFYRFQRREAQKNEIMRLQSEFEQDKKRIQQLRAARKFRPY